MSPFLIATDTTVPARGDGTSIVALSVSSVTSGSSAAIRSPGFDVHLDDVDGGKIPELGDPHFDSAHGIASTSCPGFGEDLAEPRREAHGFRAVDDAVVVRQRQRQDQPRHEREIAIDGLPRAARHAENRHLGSVDDRREEPPADAAQARHREHAALNVVRLELARAGAIAKRGQRFRDLVQVLLVRVADHGHDQAVAACPPRNRCACNA